MTKCHKMIQKPEAVRSETLGKPTCSQARVPQPGVLEAGAVQQVMTLQEAVERAEGGGGEDNGQRDGASSGQEGVDQTPAERVATGY